jgi:hypothetical protein
MKFKNIYMMIAYRFIIFYVLVSHANRRYAAQGSWVAEFLQTNRGYALQTNRGYAPQKIHFKFNETY